MGTNERVEWVNQLKLGGASELSEWVKWVSEVRGLVKWISGVGEQND